MRCHSENTGRRSARPRRAFSLIETLAALIILTMVCSGVLVVVNRCMSSAVNSSFRRHAFQVARGNMEGLLTAEAVEPGVEYGSSDRYPEIQWATVVETFTEPVSSQMWVRGVCSSEYKDIEGKIQTVELRHWLTNLTEEQASKIMNQQQQQWLDEQTPDQQDSLHDQQEPESESQPEQQSPEARKWTPEELREYIRELMQRLQR